MNCALTYSAAVEILLEKEVLGQGILLSFIGKPGISFLELLMSPGYFNR